MKKGLLIVAFLVAFAILVGTTRNRDFYGEGEMEVTGGDDDVKPIAEDAGALANSVDLLRDRNFAALNSGVTMQQFAAAPELPSQFMIADPMQSQFITFDQLSFGSGAGTTDQSQDLVDLDAGQPNNQNLPGDVDPASLAPGTVIINNISDLHTAAKMVGLAALAQIAPSKTKKEVNVKAELSKQHKSAQFSFLYGPGASDDVNRVLAKNLAQIGGISTDGWKPRNHGVFGPPQNKYTVPAELEQTILSRLQKMQDGPKGRVRVGGKLWDTAYHQVYELAHLYALDGFYRIALGEEPDAVARVLAGLGSAGLAAVAGLSTGPWGALAAAIGDIIKSIIMNVSDMLKQSDKEADIEGKVASEFNRFNQMNGYRSFLKENGYCMKSAALPDRVKKYPANLWSQSAAHNIPPVEQGTFPGAGLFAYFGASSEWFAVSLDAADIAVASDWENAIQRKIDGAGTKEISSL